MPNAGTAFDFAVDLSAHSLGAIVPVIAAERGLNYVVTPAAGKLLQKRWQTPIVSQADFKAEGPTQVWWADVEKQLKDAQVDTHLFRVGEQITLELSSKREILLVVNKEGKLPAREALKEVPPGLVVHLLARANAVILEGEPARLRMVREKLTSPGSEWKQYAVLRPDNAGKYVLTYPLHHAWAQDGLQVKPLASAIGTAGIGTLISRPRGIVNALSSVIQDYVGAPRVVGTPRLVTADAGRVANMLQSFQAANIPGFESEQSLRQLVDGMVESGQKVRVEAVPLRRETDSEVVARPLAPLGASTVTLLPSGAIVETPTSAAVTAQERQDAIEEQFESKLLALPAGEAAAPGKGVLVGGDAVTDRNDQVPTLRPWSVHADHANNALIVVTPPLGETAAVLDFLRYLDGMVAILDEPVSMVEIVAEIVDVDTNKLEEWGPRFAMATDGKLGGWPAFTRSGFDAAQGQPAGSFNNILDPTAAVGTSGLSKLTAETVAGEGLNVGALLVGSSVRLLATFRALQTEAGAHVEARPAVVTLDNTLAEISAKTSLFIPSVGLNVSSLNQVDIPMSIRVLPQVIEPEPGQLAVSMRIVVEDGNVPPAQGGGAINYSKLATSAIVPSGESVLLAGRRRHQEFDRKRRVPGVSRVPGVGQAFQNSAVSDQSQQRLILISPRIVTRLSQQQRLEQRRKGDDRLAPKGAPPLTDSPPTASQPGMLPEAAGGRSDATGRPEVTTAAAAAAAAAAVAAETARANKAMEIRQAPSSTPSVRVQRKGAAP